MKSMNQLDGSRQSTSTNQQPHVRIIEQPARCALRFRYECEGRSAGSIPGQSTTADSKTYPTIQVVGYRGTAVVVVSCVTKDYPYRPHPHNLVGKEGCKKGVCTMVINNPEMICSFTSLGIQCVKRKDIEDSLKLRESIKVDPFRTGFGHKSQSSNVDLNVVRLCFQVFIEGPEKDKYTVPLPPIVSDPIYDKKAMSELIITKLSHCSAPCFGGKEVILLCDRVTKDDIQIRFWEETNGQVTWEGFGDFQPSDVHKQVAICFRTPRYCDTNIVQPVHIQLQLRRPSDGQTSEPRPFQMLPREIDPDGLTRKRQKVEDGCLNRYLQDFLPSVVMGAEMPAVSKSASPKGDIIHVPRVSPTTVKLESQFLPSMTADTTNWQAFRPPTSSPTFQPTATNFNFAERSPTHFQTIPETQLNHQFVSPQPPIVTVKTETNEPVTSKTLTTLTSANFNNVNNNAEEVLTEKLDSLDLDIDPAELMGDINFNSIPMLTFDSGNNLGLNSRENLSNTLLASGSLQTPSVIDSESTKNPLSASQLNRLQNEFIQHLINNNNRDQ